MKFLTFSKRKILSSLLSGILVCSFVLAPVSPTLEVTVAKAVVSTFETNPALVGSTPIIAVETAATTVQSTISAVQEFIQTGLMYSLEIKEWSFDAIAWGLVNLVISQMIQSVTQWVNSGFQGSPAFVTDLKGFLVDVADQTAGDFIFGSALGGLCSPFELNIRLALDIQYRGSRSYKAQCSLSDVVDNIENFVDGDFGAGGWDGWHSMALTLENNPYGAMLEANTALEISIQNARGEQLKILDFGRGFLTKTKCDDQGHCTDVLPGAVIETQLNHALGLPGDRLTIADEVNELLGALFSQLVVQTFRGAGGLLGMTNSRYGSGDYYNRLSEQERSRPIQGKYSGTTVFSDTLNIESEYLGLKQQMLTKLNNARDYKNTRYGSDTCHSGLLTSSLQTTLTNTQAEVTATQILINEMRVFRDDYNALTNPTAPTVVIQEILTKYNALSIVEAQSVIMTEYRSLQTSEVLHSKAGIIRFDLTEAPKIQEEITSFIQGIDQVCPTRSNNNRP